MEPKSAEDCLGESQNKVGANRERIHTYTQTRTENLAVAGNDKINHAGGFVFVGCAHTPPL